MSLVVPRGRRELFALDYYQEWRWVADALGQDSAARRTGYQAAADVELKLRWRAAAAWRTGGFPTSELKLAGPTDVNHAAKLERP
jgi:hypothetical protein